MDDNTDGNTQHSGGQNDPPPDPNLQQRLGGQTAPPANIDDADGNTQPPDGQHNPPLDPNVGGGHPQHLDGPNNPRANHGGPDGDPGITIPEKLVAAANATLPDFPALKSSLVLRQNAMRDFATSMQQADATIQEQIPLIQNMAAVLNMQKDQTLFQEILAEMKKITGKIDGLTGTVDGLKTDVSGLKTDVNGLKTDVNGLKEGQKITTTELGTITGDLKALSLEQSYTIPRLHNNSKRVKGFIRLPPPKDADGSDKPWPESNPFPSSLPEFANLTRAHVVEWLQFYNQFVDRHSSAPQLRSQFARFIGLTDNEDDLFVSSADTRNGNEGGGAGGYGDAGGGPDGRGPPGGGGGHPSNDDHRNNRRNGPRSRGRGEQRGGRQGDNGSDDHRSDVSGSQTSGDRRRDRQSASEEEEESQNPSARKRRRQQPPTAQAGKKATVTATTTAKKTGKKTSKTTTQATAQQEVPQDAPETSRP